MQFRFRVDDRSMQRLMRRLNPARKAAAIEIAGREGANAFRALLQSKTPVGATGNLKSSWRISSSREPLHGSIGHRYIIQNDAQDARGVYYAQIVDQGARPHTITVHWDKNNPRSRLHWSSGDYEEFAMQVSHPGFQGFHMVEKALAASGVVATRVMNRIRQGYS